MIAPQRAARNENGFTFVELIVVVAIIGSVLVLVLANVSTIMRRARLEGEAREVAMMLMKARLEAVKRGTNVLVEFSTDTAKSSIGSYQTAVVFLDTGATAGSLDGTDTVLANATVTPGGNTDLIRIDAKDQPTPSSTAQTIDFIFTPFGSLSGASTSSSVYFSDKNNNLLEVGVPYPASGKVLITKQLSVGTNKYGLPPWAWY